MFRLAETIGSASSSGWIEPAIDPGRIKPIKRALTEIEPLSSHWLQLTRFAAEYYQYSWGEVALPSLPRALRSVPGARYAQSLRMARACAATVG